MNAKKIPLPYYEVSKNLLDQISNSSARKKMKRHTFLFKKIRNVFLEKLAYNCSINSWRVRFHKWRGVHIGKNVFIGLRCTLDHSYPEYIYLEDNVSLSGNNYIVVHSVPYKHFKKCLMSYVSPVIIKEGSWLGVGAFVLPGVTIGKYSVVSAGSIVVKNVPEKAVVSGNPSKVTHKLMVEL